MKIVIYPGSFDPITNGHLDIVMRALKISDKVIIAVGATRDKKTLFSASERIEMIRESTKGMNVEVESFPGLLVNYARNKGCKTIIRSLRAVSDFDYEFQMAVINRDLDNSLETIFLMTDKEYFYLNSSIVKEIASKGGKINHLVPKPVEEKILSKLK